ncbi:phosphonate C-P lyase system protein PhnH [Ruania alba]|uniref:Alpha-D-ribose 1-methylphosphonate 5-triphosphate synthase subunit PhnH n=1 Tax=Ruania alba TaxID=648782 RepID=A0A1H5LZI0_9MICO|nr:phosphonate C-P lyase system protein PhnH [Ruania alba]SEE82453.1 alpha-D-ribose 1-methylphosphonate 5-triphosphate synthase subunit PhnH [Ruania alba]
MTITTTPLAPVESWPVLRELSPTVSQQVFHASMEALARPGTLHRLPAGAVPEPVPAALAPLLALVDLMAPLAALPAGPDDATTRAVATVGRLTGAPVVSPGRARFALALAEPLDWVELSTGSHWSPEQGAVLVQRVHSLTASGPWQLRGPGIPPATPATIAVTGLSPAWVTQRAALVADYPAGIDCLLVADDGTLAGLPRTTTIEVI